MRDDEANRNRFVIDLLAVVWANESRPNVAVISILSKPIYKEVFPKHDIVKMSVGTAYTIACTGCCWLSAKWTDEALKSEKIAVIFDEGNAHAADFLAAYQKSKKHPLLAEWYNLGGLTFDDDKEFVPLQAADLLCYGVMKGATERKQLSDVDSLIREYTSNRIPYKVVVFGSESLRQMRAEHVRQLRERGKKVED